MILISHRGNLIGANEEKENCPDYILQALFNFEVEIDVWFIDNQFYLGHDQPTYLVDGGFLQNQKLWCHAKNLDALTEMLKNNLIHCFWHQQDDLTLTSRQYIWTYPGKKIASEKAIAVLPENIKNWDISKAAGVCSDYIEKYL
jgi:hypothetical protein